MNFSIVRYIVGMVVRFESAFLILPFIVGIIYGESDCIYYLITSIICLVSSFIITIKKPAKRSLYTREGFMSVALSWIVLSLFGALPFTLSGDIPSYVDALFETISGFTTTGSSILTDVEALSYCNLFWRSFTHWIGGMGVFVFIMAIVPFLGGSTMNLMKAESTGPSVDKLVPRIKETAKILYSIYFALTFIEIILLILNGMPVFDSLTLSFGTTGTGGFGIKNDSIASYAPVLQNIITVFMILSGINYNVFFLLIARKFRQAYKIEEARWYLIIIFAFSAIIFFNIKDLFASSGEALRHTFFQVGSIITTTGYATTDYNLWPQLAQSCLLLLMMIGACAGSTGGGIKVSRLLILFKTIKKELSIIAHPKEVKKINVNGHAVAHEVVRTTNVFIAVYFAIMFLSFLLISINEFDFTTNFTSVVSSLNNIGPGMNLVGPTGNFSMFSDFSKFVLMFDMLAGRLELFPMLALFAPGFWKKR